MKKIKIISKTKIGADALKQHIKETNNLSLQKKAMMKVLGIKNKVLSKNPYSVVVEFNNPILNERMKIKDTSSEIINFMKSLKAKDKIDYYIEVK